MAAAATRTINRILDREHVIQDLDGRHTTKQVTLKADAVALLPGTIMGQVFTSATLTPAADAGNTGDGSIGTVTADANAIPGDYTVTIVDAETDAGEFIVEDPNGQVVGSGTVAVAFDGPINFTLADGATDFATGDKIVVNLAWATEQWERLDLSGTDGSERARGVLLDGRPASASATQQGVVHHRGPVDLNANKVTWPAGINAAQTATATAQLDAVGINLAS